MTSVHSTAIIDPSAELADDVCVGPYCVVGPDVRLGAGSVLDSHVTVVRRTSIGKRNHLRAHCVIGGDPQDRKYAGEPTDLHIGDDNDIREHVTVHRGTGNGGGTTTIGSGNLLMVGSHVAHDCVIGNHAVIANQVMLAGHVKVDDGASIGGGVGVHHFATIGRLSFVGGLARISRDVPPFMIVEGHPAEVRAVNAIGMLRSNYARSDVDAMKEAYRRMYRGDSVVADAIAELRSEFADSEAIGHLCDSIEASSLGTHGRALEASRKDDKWTAAQSGKAN
ncbi:MAG: acyl-ACP--UDP-N-acetylglucosamine O-acyltransferase [Phycisphaerales bacterium]|jgi:UDP-N-acetylglucosamine acyltransferase|nr:acyl-ACP--UDP-N-acetylglucosamine O-acyltransferase [Phycisphaerales bacterium]